VNIKNTEVQELSITYLSANGVLIIDYKSATEVWRNLTVQVSLLVVFMENIKEFNISGK
jgi:predicted Ser/Thr protein kinase